MSTKQAPFNYPPSIPGGLSGAGETVVAAGNSADNSNGSALVGTTVLTGITGGFSTLIGGKIKVVAYLSGTGTAGQVVTAHLLIGGVTVRSATVGIAATSNAWSVQMDAIDDNGGDGWPTGTPYTVGISASASSALTVPIGFSGVAAQELPLS